MSHNPSLTNSFVPADHIYNIYLYQWMLSLNFLFQNPELEARIQKLKAAEEEREYRRMTKNVDATVRIEVLI